MLERAARFRRAHRITAGVSLTLLAASFAPGLALVGSGADRLGASAGWIEFEVDLVTAWLLPFAALLFAVISLLTPRTTPRTDLLVRIVTSEALVLCAFSLKSDLAFAVVVAILPFPLLLDLRALGLAGTARLFARFGALSGAALVGGAALAARDPASPIALALLTAGVFARQAIVPFHVWMPRLFERAPLPMAVAFSAPMLGVYAAVRLLLPIAPAYLLALIGGACLVTALYGAAVGLATDSKRRALGYVFMSQSALVLVGLDAGSPAAVAGALVAWTASGLALTGFAMTVAALESRRGALPLSQFAGGHGRMPFLAASFLVLGLASVGFPGTLGFVGAELLADGATARFPLFGFSLLLASALNGITVLRMYLASFCGARDRSSQAMRLTLRERVAVTCLVLLLVAGGLAPRTITESRARAAGGIVNQSR